MYRAFQEIRDTDERGERHECITPAPPAAPERSAGRRHRLAGFPAGRQMKWVGLALWIRLLVGLSPLASKLGDVQIPTPPRGCPARPSPPRWCRLRSSSRTTRHCSRSSSTSAPPGSPRRTGPRRRRTRRLCRGLGAHGDALRAGRAIAASRQVPTGPDGRPCHARTRQRDDCPSCAPTGDARQSSARRCATVPSPAEMSQRATLSGL
jgi:hypothetical protein